MLAAAELSPDMLPLVAEESEAVVQVAGGLMVKVEGAKSAYNSRQPTPRQSDAEVSHAAAAAATIKSAAPATTAPATAAELGAQLLAQLDDLGGSLPPELVPKFQATRTWVAENFKL